MKIKNRVIRKLFKNLVKIRKEEEKINKVFEKTFNDLREFAKA